MFTFVGMNNSSHTFSLQYRTCPNFCSILLFTLSSFISLPLPWKRLTSSVAYIPFSTLLECYWHSKSESDGVSQCFQHFLPVLEYSYPYSYFHQAIGIKGQILRSKVTELQVTTNNFRHVLCMSSSNLMLLEEYKFRGKYFHDCGNLAERSRVSELFMKGLMASSKSWLTLHEFWWLREKILPPHGKTQYLHFGWTEKNEILRFVCFLLSIEKSR